MGICVPTCNPILKRCIKVGRRKSSVEVKCTLGHFAELTSGISPKRLKERRVNPNPLTALIQSFNCHVSFICFKVNQNKCARRKEKPLSGFQNAVLEIVKCSWQPPAVQSNHVVTKFHHHYRSPNISRSSTFDMFQVFQFLQVTYEKMSSWNS